jgi:glutaminase
MVSAPSTDPVTAALDEVHARHVGARGGEIPTYIPTLSLVDPDQFGLALASMNGNLYRSGDAEAPFSIQSVSKPFVFALALSELGIDEVLHNVGAEPSGEAFNAISLEEGTGRPDNPMVNAGAIVTSSLVPGDPAEKFDRIRRCLSAFAGRALEMDEEAFASELETGDRNRALAYLMRGAGSLRSSAEAAVEVYFRQCSLVVTACDLAVMAATLAAGGTNPRTGERVVEPRVAEHVLTVMATCGMYDYAGEWLLRVGLPAKSGVSGCLAAASPAQFGIGAFSPRLDVRGNSVRGGAALQDLSERFELHFVHDTGLSAPVVFRSEDLSATDPFTPVTPGSREPVVHLRRLQGEIEFAAAETALDDLTIETGIREVGTWLLLDLSHVTRVNGVSAQLLDARLAGLRASGVTVFVTDALARHLLRSADAEFTSAEEAWAAVAGGQA